MNNHALTAINPVEKAFTPNDMKMLEIANGRSILGLTTHEKWWWVEIAAHIMLITTVQSNK